MKPFIQLNVLVGIFIFLIIKSSIAGNVDLVVEGVYGGVRDNVLGVLSINREKNHPSLSDERIKRLHSHAEIEIKDALKPFGFYKPNIKSSAEKSDTIWRIQYVIDPGVPVVIKTTVVDILGEGAIQKEFAYLRKSAPFNSGNVLNHKVYEETKSSMQRLALELGYFDAKFTKNEIQIDLNKNTAQIYLVFDTGIRYQFGMIKFDQSEFNEKFLRNFLQIKQGDSYSLKKMIEIRNIYGDSDHFQLIDVALRDDEKQGRQIPVQIKLVAKKKSKYNAGIGYGTDSGSRISLGFERRRINRNGHKFNIGINSTGNYPLPDSINPTSPPKLFSIISNYTIPLRRPRTDQLVFKLGWEEQETENPDKFESGHFFDEKIYFSINHGFLSHGWQKARFLRLEYNEFRPTADSERNFSELIIPGMNWTRINADDRIYTRRGNRFEIELKGSLEALFSSVSFFQLEISDKFVQKVGQSSRVITRLDTAYTYVSNEQDFSRLPISLRYFTGGDRSVRGYPYNTLYEQLDDQRGAKHLIVGSLEYEHNLYTNWAFALFYDVGNAINHSNELKKMNNGLGFGFRYKSPVGMIRVDLAYGVDKVDQKSLIKMLQVHVNVGPDL